MTALTAGLTRMDEAMDGKQWSIRGMCTRIKAESDDAVVYTVTCEPEQFIPVHVHSEIDEIIQVQAGELQVKLDGMWSTLRAGDLMRIPRGLPHGFFNTSAQTAEALFIMSPAADIHQMFDALNGVTDTSLFVTIAARYGLDVLPLDANE